MVANILVNWLVQASVYAMLAVGFSLIFSIARVTFLCYTAFYMLSCYLLYFFFFLQGWNLLLGIIFSIGITAILGVLSYRFIVHRVREWETATLVITVALGLAIQEVVSLGFGEDYLGVPSFIQGSVKIINVGVTYQHILTFGVAVILLIALWTFLTKHKMGIVVRAVADDREVANLMGINEGKVIILITIISTVMAAVAGVIMLPLVPLEPGMWISPFVVICAIVIIGGLGSLKGSVIGAFVLSLAEMLVVFLVPGGSYLRSSMMLVVMVVVLIIKPEGLFGVVFEEERL